MGALGLCLILLIVVQMQDEAKLKEVERQSQEAKRAMQGMSAKGVSKGPRRGRGCKCLDGREGFGWVRHRKSRFNVHRHVDTIYHG